MNTQVSWAARGTSWLLGKNSGFIHVIARTHGRASDAVLVALGAAITGVAILTRIASRDGISPIPVHLFGASHLALSARARSPAAQRPEPLALVSRQLIGVEPVIHAGWLIQF